MNIYAVLANVLFTYAAVATLVFITYYSLHYMGNVPDWQHYFLFFAIVATVLAAYHFGYAGLAYHFGYAGLVLLAYYFGYEMGNAYKNKWQNYFTVFYLVTIVCLALWASYGTHIEDSDPLTGGGETVQDFEPTAKERNEYGLEHLLTFEIAALYGVYRRNRKDPQET